MFFSVQQFQQTLINLIHLIAGTTFMAILSNLCGLETTSSTASNTKLAPAHTAGLLLQAWTCPRPLAIFSSTTALTRNIPLPTPTADCQRLLVHHGGSNGMGRCRHLRGVQGECLNRWMIGSDFFQCTLNEKNGCIQCHGLMASFLHLLSEKTREKNWKKLY